MFYRTHNCGELNKNNIGTQVILSGWINKIRNFGNLFFIDVRDYFGITQLVVSKKILKKVLNKEYLINIQGKVVKRISKNKNLPTGDIEVLVFKLIILNESCKLPFILENDTDGKEEDRMTYRYLDLRRSIMKNNLIFRNDFILMIRKFFSYQKFIEIDTPILINYTPEGARGFFVPSRKHKEKFYALPQSPQIFKQLLMISGFDRYFQITKCFRDEDSRSDRQIEFTQLDCEMSFVDTNNILKFFEKFIKYLFKFNNIKFIKSIPKISYYDSIRIYGTDTPDIRFGMKFCEINHLFINHFFKEKELIIGIKINALKNYKIDQEIERIKITMKNENIFWIQCLSEKKFFYSKKCFITNDDIKSIAKFFKTKPGDYIFISYGNKKESRNLLNKIRIKLIDFLSIKNPNLFEPIWVTQFPLFKWEKNYKKYKSVHHPFTSPLDEDIHLLEKNPKKIRSKSYDLVINGIEIGSGSIRIYKKNIQKLIFNILGFSEKEINSKFGFFIKALQYGTPPHGGIAFGIDRLINLIKNGNNIKDFIAFPKNNNGIDLMTNAPSDIR